MLLLLQFHDVAAVAVALHIAVAASHAVAVPSAAASPPLPATVAVDSLVTTALHPFFQTWYFGLIYVDDRGRARWMEDGEKVFPRRRQKGGEAAKRYFEFKFRFFPEGPEEVILEHTLRLFFKQVGLKKSYFIYFLNGNSCVFIHRSSLTY